MIVYAIIDLRSSPDHPLGDAVETFLRREDAERFIAEVRGDDPDLASYLRIEERELEAGGGAPASTVPHWNAWPGYERCRDCQRSNEKCSCRFKGCRPIRARRHP